MAMFMLIVFHQWSVQDPWLIYMVFPGSTIPFHIALVSDNVVTSMGIGGSYGVRELPGLKVVSY